MLKSTGRNLVSQTVMGYIMWMDLKAPEMLGKLRPEHYAAIFVFHLLAALSFQRRPNPPSSTLPAPVPTSTSFHVTSGSNENYFFRDNITTGQLLLTSTSASASITRRLVVALPAGNNGALVTGQWNDEEHSGTRWEQRHRGGFDFQCQYYVGVTIVGAVRAMRDYVEGSGTMHEIFDYTLPSFSSTEVRLHRQYINDTNSSPSPSLSLSSSHHNPKPHTPVFKSVDLVLSIPSGSSARLSVVPSSNGTFTPPTIDIILPRGSSRAPRRFDSQTSLTEDSSKVGQHKQMANHVRVQVMTNETSLTGLDVDGLFMTPNKANTTTIKNVLPTLPENVTEQVSFLTFQNKFTAGGWRFLTYFGRDSMIALRMLMPLLTPNAVEDALGAVIERANSTGALCHEKTIGDYASFVNIGNGQPDLGNTPFYDYKMIDTAMAHYFLELPQGKNRSSQFLAKQATLQSGTYLDIVNRITSYNINRALPFFNANPPTFAQLLAFRPGQPVGNWRDSNQGTGYGTIPFDVNVALVLADLRAIDNLAKAGILNLGDLDLPAELNITAVAEKWEQEAPGLLEISVDGATAEQMLEDFVQEASLDSSLLGNSSLSGGNVSFFALSLMADGSPVEVLNSDMGFNLLFGTNVTAAFLQHVVNALTPYPRGLLTNIGMVVGNPAYDSNRTNVQVLDRTAHHGTVVWSFQQALMTGGLARQLGFCNSTASASSVDINPPPSPKPVWCGDLALVQRLQAAQARLWTSINGASSSIYSEVWSYSFDNTTKMFSVADLATLSPDGTESDAIQLWSYGFLGLVEPS
ncbi:hypothetical protein CPB84DRAFT_1912879 [Gymnopilus junonius]|uniref:Uncharacterized protein n=1 Tax=Gymnopilus junonius TaxID=109634 RepID=A0A9P5TUL1_GYMJU|nr:hypothetical protein CPB84DRAFT_1912879 [Gymnopilus junonius]